MKKLTLGLIAVMLAFTFVSCASQPAPADKPASGLPDFVMNPPVADDAIYGVGYAKLSNLAMAKNAAMTNARADIARQVETQIQAAVVDYAQESGVDDNTQVVRFVETITKEVTNQTLKGVKMLEFAQDEDGGVWILMSMGNNMMMEAAEETFARNEDAAFAEFKAAQALDFLDSQVKENPSQSEPVTD